MGLITNTIGAVTKLIPNIKTILITTAVVAPLSLASGYHLKTLAVKAGQTDTVVKANEDLAKDGVRSENLGKENLGKKRSYENKVKRIEAAPANGPTFDAGFVRRLGERIDAGASSR